HGAVFVIVQVIYTYRAPETASICGDTAIVIDKVIFSFKMYNGLVIGITVSCNFIENTLVFPGSGNRPAHGIGYFFREFIGIGQVIPVAPFMDPGCFGKIRKVYR